MKVNYHPDPIDLYIQKEMQLAFGIYCDNIYPEGESIMCKIHDLFHKLEDGAHNCIGCNLANYTQLLHFSLGNYEIMTYPLEAFSSTILFAYLLVERFEEIFRIIELPEYYRQQHFQIFIKIRRWANFLKHPKAFMFVHHPKYYFEDEIAREPDDDSAYIFIDQKFIDEYYKDNNEKNKLYSILTNKKNVIVCMPNLKDLVQEFCNAQKRFISLIEENKVFKEKLDSNTTLKNYFEG